MICVKYQILKCINIADLELGAVYYMEQSVYPAATSQIMSVITEPIFTYYD